MDAQAKELLLPLHRSVFPKDATDYKQLYVDAIELLQNEHGIQVILMLLREGYESFDRKSTLNKQSATVGSIFEWATNAKVAQERLSTILQSEVWRSPNNFVP